MRTASEKLAIIRLVEESELSVRRTLREIRVSRSSFYRWYAAYAQDGLDGLENQGGTSRRHWNRIPDSVRSLVVEVALESPDLTPRELAWHISRLLTPVSDLASLRAHLSVSVRTNLFEGEKDENRNGSTV